ncbi:hypothetical protein V5799_024162 [Amblyomma americanum]|uniref:Uncharacterized protein n=1 Tax=Amblyomma americanum TaxID=6943 RepID=A0AAQ4ED42_AMBAM
MSQELPRQAPPSSELAPIIQARAEQPALEWPRRDIAVSDEEAMVCVDAEEDQEGATGSLAPSSHCGIQRHEGKVVKEPHELTPHSGAEVVHDRSPIVARSITVAAWTENSNPSGINSINIEAHTEPSELSKLNPDTTAAPRHLLMQCGEPSSLEQQLDDRPKRLHSSQSSFALNTGHMAQSSLEPEEWSRRWKTFLIRRPLAEEKCTQASIDGDCREHCDSVCKHRQQRELFRCEEGISFDDACGKIQPEEWSRRWKRFLIRRNQLEDELQLSNDLESKRMIPLTPAVNEGESMQLSSDPSELQEEEEAVANSTGDVQWLYEVQPLHEFEPEAEVSATHCMD